MKLLFALLTCSAAFPHFREADTGGGTSTGWTPPTPPAPPDAPADPAPQVPVTEGSGADAAGLSSDQGGIHQAAPAVEQTGAVQEAPEPPLQDGAKVHEGASSAPSAPPVEAPKEPVMPDYVRNSIVKLIVETVGKIESDKAQAAQPSGGVGSAAAAVEARFQSVPLAGDKLEKVQMINGVAKELALLIEEFAPAGREKDMAHAAVMAVAMFTNAAISRG